MLWKRSKRLIVTFIAQLSTLSELNYKKQYKIVTDRLVENSDNYDTLRYFPEV